jgi:hypothetical protein
MASLRHVWRAGGLGALLLVVTGMLFTSSVALRSPWFGKSPVHPDTWLTSATLLFSKEWYWEGPVHLRFGLLMDPNSIETPTPALRTVYSSYPPGVVLPVYALSKVFQREPSLRMLMAYGLFNQFVVGMSLSLMVFLFLRRLGFPDLDAGLLAVVPPAMIFFLPAPAFHFQMGYLHDLSVLMPFVLYVFLEFLRDLVSSSRGRAAISGFQAILAFWGILCDWLFAFVALCLYLKRLATGAIVAGARPGLARGFGLFLWNSLRFWFTSGLALALFILQLKHFNQFPAIVGKFRERSGLTRGDFLSWTTNTYFWKNHMVHGYGTVGRWLVYASAIGLLGLLVYAGVRRLLRKRPEDKMNLGLSLSFLLLAPGLLHVYVFSQHSSHRFHYFAATKFGVPLAALPFAVLPATLLAALGVDARILSLAAIRTRLARRPVREVSPRWTLLGPALFLAAVGYVHSQFPQMLDQFNLPLDRDPVALGAFIVRNTGYEDILFTPAVALETSAVPVVVAQALKRVYPGASLQSIYDKLKPVTGEYVVNSLLLRDDLDVLSPELLRLLSCAYDRCEFNDILLYKIRKEEFLKLCREMGVAG